MAETTFAAAGGTLPGYVAVPEGAGPWPGVVVVHEIFGLTHDIRRQADRFAARGYLALAPDLYGWGATPRCLVATLRTLLRGSGRALDDLQAARAALAERDDCTGRVGVVGFCLGGGLAILVSPQGFEAAAPNYGDVPKDADRRLRNACPIVASYGGRDGRLRGSADRLETVLAALGVDHDVKEYPDAKHGFLFEHSGLAGRTEPWLVKYDAAAADDAWDRIFAFFDTHLGEPVR